MTTRLGLSGPSILIPPSRARARDVHNRRLRPLRPKCQSAAELTHRTWRVAPMVAVAVGVPAWPGCAMAGLPAGGAGVITIQTNAPFRCARGNSLQRLLELVATDDTADFDAEFATAAENCPGCELLGAGPAFCSGCSRREA